MKMPAKEEIRQAIEVAQAADFIDSMEGKLEAPIAQEVRRFGRGKSSVSPSRAPAIKKPSIYIFDDALSALDFRRMQRCGRALKIAPIKYDDNCHPACLHHPSRGANCRVG
jgi:ATP-binding cassette subfamily B protein